MPPAPLLSDRELMVGGDRTNATLRLRATCQAMTPPITFLTRLRLDTVLHDPPPPRKPGQRERPRIVGVRQPSPQAVPADLTVVWTALCQHWPDGTRRHIQTATGTARACARRAAARQQRASTEAVDSDTPCSSRSRAVGRCWAWRRLPHDQDKG